MCIKILQITQKLTLMITSFEFDLNIKKSTRKHLSWTSSINGSKHKSMCLKKLTHSETLQALFI